MNVDSLLEDLKSLNLFCIGYASVVVTVVRSKFINIVSSIMTEGFRWSKGGSEVLTLKSFCGGPNCNCHYIHMYIDVGICM